MWYCIPDEILRDRRRLWRHRPNELFVLAVPKGSQGIRDHVHLFEVDETSKIRLVALVQERHVLQNQRHKRYDGWLHLGN